MTKEDDVTNSVSVFIAPDKLITFSMEDRDANEFAIVLAGYYRLIVGECNVVIIIMIILSCLTRTSLFLPCVKMLVAQKLSKIVEFS